MTHVRAKFSGGALHPLEPLYLAEGQEVLVSIEESPPQDSPQERMERTISAAGSLKGKIDGEAMKRMIYEARRTGSRETPEP